MLAIGRALMAHPRLLLMDEPSLGLAPAMADVVFAFVGEARGLGVSVLLVEQNVVRALGVADRGVVMERGAVVAAGSRDELMRTRQVQDAYLGTG